MKNNTQNSKQLLEQLIKSLPNDFSLNQTKYYLKCALNEIIHIENKRNKRENLQQKTIEEHKEKMQMFMNPTLNVAQAKEVIENIDKMIAVEQQKLIKANQSKNEIISD
jgi:hypothetical protein